MDSIPDPPVAKADSVRPGIAPTKATNWLSDKRILLATFLCLGIAANFWLGSRYPDLGEKAMMGGEVVLEDPLGFEAFLFVDSAAPFLKRVLYTTINWIHTNRRGMIFGVLFAAGVMTLLSVIRRVGFAGILPNTLLGVMIGAPLGVCVNCAAPIASGLHAAGMRLETTLATMVSSPTLNIIVLTMLFSLFPLHIALMKVGLTLLFLLVILPALSRWAFGAAPVDPSRSQALVRGAASAILEDQRPEPAEQRWGSALAWLVRQYSRNLWFIVRRTVPLMLLAGFLGVLVITIFPWDVITGDLFYTRRATFFWTMALVSAVGLFLPVPMAFDVVLSAAFLASGVPEGHVMVLLLTLGSFSIYSFFIVWRQISSRVAILVSTALIALAMMGGVAADEYGKWREPEQWATALAALDEAATLRAQEPELPEAKSYESFAADLDRERVRWTRVPVDGPAGIAVERAHFQLPSAPGGRLFERHYGEAFGLARVDHLPITYKFSGPFYRAYPVAAGDVHNDGWVDLLFGSDRGLYLYANRGGREFILQRIDIPELRDLYVGNAALIDLNNDGWLDIFFSAYRNGEYVIYNDRGRFHQGGLRKLPETGANLAHAVAFCDLNRSGLLDIVYGNWFTGHWNRFPPEESGNAILWNKKETFQVEKLREVPGETLSVLISDINLDGNPDLLIGNDFLVPDTFYFGRPGGKLKMVTREEGVFPHTTTTTMSFDSADIDNNLDLEIYVGQVTGQAPRQRAKMATVELNDLCAEYDDAAWKSRCERRRSVHQVVSQASKFRDSRRCLVIPDLRDRGDCIAYVLLQKTVRSRDSSGCRLFPARWEAFAYICQATFKKPFPDSRALSKEGIPQILNSNVLWVAGPDGRYTDRAKEMGVELGGWTWNAKFADLDNDEWQDLYIANGRIASARRETKFFYRNNAGKGFVDKTAEAGLRSFVSSGSYVYADFDNDGDLDIITVTLDGPIWVYRNSTQQSRAIMFELRDSQANTFGVGSRVVIRYGEGERSHQMREIKASGGFLSFDPYIAHFGLGAHDKVTRVEIPLVDRRGHRAAR